MHNHTVTCALMESHPCLDESAYFYLMYQTTDTCTKPIKLCLVVSPWPTYKLKHCSSFKAKGNSEAKARGRLTPR